MEFSIDLDSNKVKPFVSN